MTISAHQEKMRGQQFSLPEDTVEAVKNHVLELSQSELKNAGEYFEKQ